MRPPFRWGRLAATLLTATLLSGCFTGALWGFTPEVDATAGETNLVYDDTTQWSWGLFFKRVLLTPFSVGLDLLTCPVQACLYGWDDDKKDCDKDDPRTARHKH